MSKATNRKLRRQLERKAVQRERDEQQARQRRLKGFRTATTGDVLRLSEAEANRLAVQETRLARRERARS